MERILKTDYFHIYKKNTIYKIDFFTSQYPLVQSLIKSKCIAGASTDESYKTITFKAESVKSLSQYIHECDVKNGRPTLSIIDATNMTYSLAQQLSTLITFSHHTILGYHPEYIIIINDKIAAFLGSEFVVEIDVNTNQSTVCCPYSPSDFFFSPEIVLTKELPMKIHYKTSYFSLACLIFYVLLGENEFYKEYIRDYQSINIIDYLENHPVKDSKLYWFLSRCLTKDPNERSMIYV